MNMISENFAEYELTKTNSTITSKSGLALFFSQLVSSGINKLVEKYLPAPGSNRGYSADHFVYPILLSITGGGRTIEDVRNIKNDPGLMKLCGFEKVPSSDAIGKWIRKPDVLQGLKQINETIRKSVIKRIPDKEFILDSDATLIESSKESAEYTYKEFPGFSVLYSFLSGSGLCVANEFRTGNASAANGILEQLKSSEDLLKKCNKKISAFRSDSAAYQGKILDYCEKQGITYYVAADMDSAVKKTIRSIDNSRWVHLKNEKYIAETYHSMNKNSHGFSLIVKREERKSHDTELKLFPDEKNYFHYAIATNEDNSSPEEIYSTYCERGNAENFIKETKYGYGLNYCPSQDLTGNAVWFEIGIMAYNLMIAFRTFCLSRDFHSSHISTIRWQFLFVAGKVVSHGRKLFLKVSNSCYELLRKTKEKKWSIEFETG